MYQIIANLYGFYLGSQIGCSWKNTQKNTTFLYLLRKQSIICIYVNFYFISLIVNFNKSFYWQWLFHTISWVNTSLSDIEISEKTINSHLKSAEENIFLSKFFKRVYLGFQEKMQKCRNKHVIIVRIYSSQSYYLWVGLETNYLTLVWWCPPASSQLVPRFKSHGDKKDSQWAVQFSI